MLISSSGTTGNRLIGNYVGTDRDGAHAIGNDLCGVSLNSGAQQNQVGTNGDGITDGAETNLISGNSGEGIKITDAGTSAQSRGWQFHRQRRGWRRGDSQRHPRRVDSEHRRQRHRRLRAGMGNTIVFNGGAGVAVTGAAAVGNAVRGNLIHDNTGLGIDLGGDNAVQLNDASGHVGPNNYQNFPLLDSVIAGATTTISGSLQSTPSTQFYLDFFANTVGDPSGHGEGQRYLGSLSVTTDATGAARFNAALAMPSNASEFITATVTDAAGNTSEFSLNFVNTPPAVAINGSSNASVGQTVVFEGVVSDPDPGTDLIYTWSVTNPGDPGFTLPADVATNQPTLQFAAPQAGTYEVSLEVSDGRGGTGTAAPWTLSAEITNPSVLISGVPAFGNTGTAVSLSGNVVEPAGAVTTSYSWSVTLDGQPYALPSGTATDAANFTFTPADAGVYGVALAVTDSAGGSGSATVSFAISGGTLSAAILGVPGESPEGVPVRLSTEVNGDYVPGSLIYTWVVTKNGAAFAGPLDDTTGLFVFTPDDEGDYLVALSVRDNRGQSSPVSDVPITVVHVSPNVTIGGALGRGHRGHCGPLDRLGERFRHRRFLHALLERFQQRREPRGGDRRGGRLLLHALDGGHRRGHADSHRTGEPDASTSLLLPVGPGTSVNLSAGTLVEGTGQLYAAIDNPKAGVSYTFTWSVAAEAYPFSVFGPGVSSGDTSSGFSFQPPTPGPYLVTAVADGSDGSQIAASQIFQAGNVAPSIVSIAVPVADPDAPLYEGTLVTLSAEVADPGGSADLLQYSWDVIGPENHHFTGGGPTLDVTPIEWGQWEVSLTVTDSSGESDTEIAFFDVTHLPPIPIVQSTGTTINDMGTSDPADDVVYFSLEAAINDPGSDDFFTYAWSVTSMQGYTLPPEVPTNGPTLTFSGPLSHTYTVSLHVTDDDGGDETVSVPDPDCGRKQHSAIGREQRPARTRPKSR